MQGMASQGAIEQPKASMSTEMETLIVQISEKLDVYERNNTRLEETGHRLYNSRTPPPDQKGQQLSDGNSGHITSLKAIFRKIELENERYFTTLDKLDKLV